jgi:hypothetical protein
MAKRDYPPPPGPGPFPRKGPEGGGRAPWWYPSPITGPARAPRGRLGAWGAGNKTQKARTRREQITLFNSSLRDARSCSGRDCLLLDLMRDSTGLRGQWQMNKKRAIYSTRSDATGELGGFFVALLFFSAAHRPQ